MQQFEYVIMDELGLHARPAGQLVKQAAKFDSEITIRCKEKTVSLKKILGVMALGVKCGDAITIAADGPDEEEAAAVLRSFLEENF